MYIQNQFKASTLQMSKSITKYLCSGPEYAVRGADKSYDSSRDDAGDDTIDEDAGDDTAGDDAWDNIKHYDARDNIAGDDAMDDNKESLVLDYISGVVD